MTPAALRETRRRLGLTQTQLADALPSTRRAIQEWEKARREPPAYLYRALRDLERELTEASSP